MCICLFTASSQSSLQEGIIFSPQEQIDIFQFCHPNFTEIEGDMKIRTDAEDMEWNISDILAEKKSRGQFNHGVPQLDSLIQIMDSTYHWQWDTKSGGWEIKNRSIDYVYDDNNNQTSYLTQNWYGIEWVNYSLGTYTYDANNNKTSSLYQHWYGIEWVNQSLLTKTYDANNNQTSSLYQKWNDIEWVNHSLHTHTYDANNNKTSTLWQHWNGIEWENDYHYTYTYDVNDNLTSTLDQHWNGIEWENYYLSTYTYDANNNHTSTLTQHWNSIEWENYILSTYTYDANDNRTIFLQQHWNGIEWENDYHYIYTYDVNDNRTIALQQHWNGSDWVNAFQGYNTFDDNNFLRTFSYKYWDDTGTWIYYGDSTYHYFHTMVFGTDDLIVSMNSILVYPNPTSSEITISGIDGVIDEISIYNKLGQRVIYAVATNKNIDVSMLPPGLYAIEVSWDGYRVRQKLIVQ